MKPNIYEVVYSIRDNPDEWSYFSCTEDKVKDTVAIVLATKTWQLECVTLVKSSNPNRYDMPSE